MIASFEFVNSQLYVLAFQLSSMARKAAAAIVPCIAYVWYKDLVPDAPDAPDAPNKDCPVWRLARDGSTQVYQLTKPTGKWFGLQRQVLFEYSLTYQLRPRFFSQEQEVEQEVVCYIGFQPFLEDNIWVLAFDHIETTARKNKPHPTEPIKLVITFEYGCAPGRRKELQELDYDDDQKDYFEEWSERAMSKVLA